MSRRLWTLRSTLALLLWCVVAAPGCGGANPLNPEAGFPLPKDPGTVVVHVNDETDAPVVNALVEIAQPNQFGREFRVGAWTDATGTQKFPLIPAGARLVEVKPPAGYKAGANGVTQTADVRKGQTTTVTFILARDVTSDGRTTDAVPSTSRSRALARP